MSLLTSDFYGLLFGLFLFNATINKIYPIAYVLIMLGIILYNVRPAPEPKFRKRLMDSEECLNAEDQPASEDKSAMV